MASNLTKSELEVPPNKKLAIIFSTYTKGTLAKKSLKKYRNLLQFYICIIEIKINRKKLGTKQVG